MMSYQNLENDQVIQFNSGEFFINLCKEVQSSEKGEDIYSKVIVFLSNYSPYKDVILWLKQDKAYYPIAWGRQTESTLTSPPLELANPHLLDQLNWFSKETATELGVIQLIPFKEVLISKFRILKDNEYILMFLFHEDMKAEQKTKHQEVVQMVTKEIQLVLENNEMQQNIEQMESFAKENTELYQHMERKVEERTLELQQALDVLKKAQDQLVQSEKMAALGSLVAGIAHEINTPIGIGVTAITHLQLKIEELSNQYKENLMKRSDLEKFLQTAKESAKIIQVNLERGSDLIKSFKKVAVDQSKEEKRMFKVGEYIKEIIISLQPKLKRTTHSVKVDCSEFLSINQNPGAFSQMMTNLIMNSLIHGFSHMEHGQITISVRDDAGNIKLIYKDNGKGMEKEVVEKIFDPFFTTNRAEGGTGLGMHIVYNIVTQSFGGTIQCESQIGEGTQFLIVIPK